MSKRALRIFYGAMALLMLIPMALNVLGYPRQRTAVGPQNVAAAEATRVSLLPIIQTAVTETPSPTSTPPPTPTAAPYSTAGVLFVTRNSQMNASTFNTGSFVIVNSSLGSERLTQLRIDLSTAIFPKMVFDPEGLAGDTVAKDVVIDHREGVDDVNRHFEGPHDDGFDVLVLDFTYFDSGDFVAFSVDVDPTSIRGVGAPGPAESGSVSGIELVGATITMTFDNGAVLAGQLWRMPDPGNDAGAYVDLRSSGQPAAPTLAIVGQSAPAVVAVPNQVARVSGPVGQPVMVTVIEGGMFTEGVPGGGHNVQPFDANNALVYREYTAIVGPDGTADVPIALSRNGIYAGINVITAAYDDHYGRKGLVAAPVVLQLGGQ